MGSQYANLEGRHFVNADFVAGVRQAYPATTKKIPLGFSTYTGWTGKDEVLFTLHSGVDELEKFGSTLYEVTWDPVNPGAFMKDILGAVKHDTFEKKASRRRTVAARSVEALWGPTLGDLKKASEERRISEERARRRRAFVEQARAEMAREAASTPSPDVKDWISWDPSE